MPNLNRKMIEGLEVALPPLDLQHRYAAVVESVEQQRARHRGHFAELDTLFASLQSPCLPRRPLSPMEVSANFAFLKQSSRMQRRARSLRSTTSTGDPRASCFHARHALERLVKRVYKVERTLSPPKVHEPGRLPQRARVPCDRARGRVAEGGVHPAGGQRGGARQQDTRAGAGVECRAGAGARPLLGGRTYLRKGAESLRGKTYDESLVPTPEPSAAPASVEELDALKSQLDAADDARKEIEGELEALRERLAAIKAENETVPETRDWNESTTRRLIIDLAQAACRLVARRGTRP